MRTMANLDYTYIIQELKPLEGKHLDKFYELGDGLFRMKIGSDSVLIELGKRLHITKLLEEAPEPTGFVMKARKELGGRKLKEVRQKGRDRIVIFDFGGMELVCEMFGGGNLVLVQDGKIVYVYERKEWKDRSLKPGEAYSFPPSGERELGDILDNPGEKTIAAELVPLNIGITYVKKILALARVEESKKGSEVTAAEKKRIKETYAERMENLSPSVIFVDGKPSDYSLFSEVRSTPRCKEESKEEGRRANWEPFESLSAALDECFGVAEKENPEEARIRDMLAKQEARLRELDAEEKDAKMKGDLIFEKYAEVEEVLEAYRKGGLAAAEKIAEEKGWKLDKKNKEIEMEL